MQLPNGCWCSNFIVHPSNWKRADAHVENVKWYIKYRFYDGKGKKLQVCIRGMNKFKTAKERREVTEQLIADEIVLLKNEGYNPIAQTKFLPVEFDGMNKNTSLVQALAIAVKNIDVEPRTRKEIENVLPHFNKAAMKIRCDGVPITEVRRMHIIAIFDQLKKNKGYWSACLYNHYRTYLQILFCQLITLQVIEFNPIDKYFKKQKEVEKLKRVLTAEEKEKVRERLNTKQFRGFWRYLNIFYHSGARTTELLKLQGKDVDLKNQYIKIVTKKGAKYREVLKIIMDSALPYWSEIMQDCKAEDYVFSRGLQPGVNKIRPDQISKRWWRLIKKALDIEADFNSLRHSHSDEIAEILGIKKAQGHLDHTSEKTTRIYAIGQKKRDDQDLKQLPIKF